jgi:hypothetical protein
MKLLCDNITRIPLQYNSNITRIQCWGVTEYMYRRYVFRIQIITVFRYSYNLNSWYLEYSYIVEINGLHDDTSVSAVYSCFVTNNF